MVWAVDSSSRHRYFLQDPQSAIKGFRLRSTTGVHDHWSRKLNLIFRKALITILENPNQRLLFRCKLMPKVFSRLWRCPTVDVRIFHRIFAHSLATSLYVFRYWWKYGDWNEIIHCHVTFVSFRCLQLTQSHYDSDKIHIYDEFFYSVKIFHQKLQISLIVVELELVQCQTL